MIHKGYFLKEKDNFKEGNESTHENINMNQKSCSYEAAGAKPTKKILRFNSCSEV